MAGKLFVKGAICVFVSIVVIIRIASNSVVGGSVNRGMDRMIRIFVRTVAETAAQIAFVRFASG